MADSQSNSMPPNLAHFLGFLLSIFTIKEEEKENQTPMLRSYK